MQEPASPNLRFVDSMPRPLIVTFLAFAAVGIGLVVWVFVHPPSASQVALELRRSPPGAGYTHNALRVRPVSVPTTIPAFDFPNTACVKGIVVEGGEAAQTRLRRVLGPLCDLAEDGDTSPELTGAIRALSTARVRFALFTRTGDLSTTQLAERRILLAIALSRTNLAAGVIAPLLVHEGFHLQAGGMVTAAQEFRARRVEYEACKALFEPDHFPRGCDDAQAMVQLGQARAVELLVRAGYPT